MKITSTCLLACLAAAMMNNADAWGSFHRDPPTGTYSEAGGHTTVKTSFAKGSGFSASVQSSFAAPDVAGASTESAAGLDLEEEVKGIPSSGVGSSETYAEGGGGRIREGGRIQSEANTEGKIDDNIFRLVADSSGSAYSSAMGAATGDNKVGQTVDGSYVEGDTTRFDSPDRDGFGFFGFAGARGTTVGGAHAGPVLAGAGAIEGVNEGTFDVVTSPVDEFFPVDNGGRKLQRSWYSPLEVLVVESGGSSKVNVKDGGTASSGQVNVASAADLPDLDYEGSQSKSLAAAEVGKMGNPFVTNGAEAYGFAASGNDCDRKAARDGPDADLCEQNTVSGQSAVAANYKFEVGVDASGYGSATNGADRKKYKGTQAGNINLGVTNNINTGMAAGVSFGTASKSNNPGSLAIGTGIQTANDVRDGAEPATFVLENTGFLDSLWG